MVDISLTMVIQWINFGILLWFLKKLLFAPITRLLEKRAADVKQLKGEADEDRRRARGDAQQAEESLIKARKSSLDMVAASRTEAFKQRENIIARARDEADGLLRQARSETELEAEQAKEELREATVELSLQIAEKVIKRSLDQEDQKKMAQRFLDEMKKR